MQTQSWADCRTTVSRATIVSTSGASKGLESSSARAATSPLLRRSKAFMPVARSRDFMSRREILRSGVLPLAAVQTTVGLEDTAAEGRGLVALANPGWLCYP